MGRSPIWKSSKRISRASVAADEVLVKPVSSLSTPRMREFESMRKMTKRVIGAGMVAGVSYAVLRAWRARTTDASRSISWESAPFPFPPVPRPVTAAESMPVAAWVGPNGSSACPATHPVKAKIGSGIYHEPGGANYDRTQPDRCYLDAAAAEADGLRRSKF